MRIILTLRDINMFLCIIFCMDNGAHIYGVSDAVATFVF
jgi:hypothetical protein